MTTKTIKKANAIIKVERWIERFGNKGEDCDGITADKLPNGKWLCEIEIPEVNIKVRAICKTESAAMLRAADKACAIIQEFLRNNMSINRTIENVRNWEMEVGENGEFISIGLSKKQREREGKQMQKMMEDSIETIKKAIKKLGKINGASENIFIQVLDRSLFNKNKPITDMIREVNSAIENDYDVSEMTVCYDEDNNSVIVIGYTYPSVEKGELN